MTLEGERREAGGGAGKGSYLVRVVDKLLLDLVKGLEEFGGRVRVGSQNERFLVCAVFFPFQLIQVGQLKLAVDEQNVLWLDVLVCDVKPLLENRQRNKDIIQKALDIYHGQGLLLFHFLTNVLLQVPVR